MVHHAAALYRQVTAIEDIRAVHSYHLSKGWGGIGYHRVLAETVNGGPIGDFWVSDPNLQRAHIAYRNHECIGLSMLTNVDTHPNALPAAKWLAALIDAVANLKRLYPAAKIVGHREVALPGYGTACPGKRWFDWRGELLAEVDNALGNGPTLWRTYKVINARGVPVRTGPSRNFPVAWDGKCILPMSYPPLKGPRSQAHPTAARTCGCICDRAMALCMPKAMCRWQANADLHQNLTPATGRDAGRLCRPSSRGNGYRRYLFLRPRATCRAAFGSRCFCCEARARP